MAVSSSTRAGTRAGSTPWAGCLLGLASSAIALSPACSTCTRQPNRNAPVARAVAESLATTLGRPTPEIECPSEGDIQTGFICTGRWRDGESSAGKPQAGKPPAGKPGNPFEVSVSGRDDSGEPVWKPRGALKFEYEIARGFTAAVRARLRDIRCPGGGDLAAGFQCQLVLEDGTATVVHVGASAEAADKFVWRADGVLMLSAIEREIQRALASDGRQAAIDCGEQVQTSEPGGSFECAIRFGDGGSSIATVSVVDAEGHVQYRIVDASRTDGGPTK